MSAVLKPHKVEVTPWPAGGFRIQCSGCGTSKIRTNDVATKMVVDHHERLNAQQFRGYSDPGRGAEGESSN